MYADKSILQKVCIYVLLVFLIPHLHPVPHLYEGTGRVEGPSSTGIQVCAVIVVHHPDIIHTVGLKNKQGDTCLSICL